MGSTLWGDEPVQFSSFSDRTRYDPVGYCIYCGSKESLTDEHTLASGLGGRHVLPKSSCATCRDAIAPSERYLMQTLLHNARGYYGIRSHRMRPQPPTTIQIRKKSGEIVEIEGDPREIPFVIALPVFPNPTLLHDGDPSQEFDLGMWKPKPRNLSELLKKHDAREIISKPIRLLELATVIAKTAHAHATALLRPGTYKPLLCDLILGKTRRFIDVVGGEILPNQPHNTWRLLPPTPNHINTFLVFDWFRPTDGKCFLVGAVRLFSNLGAPTYFAVLGEPIPPRPPWRIKPDVAKRLGGRHTIFAPRAAAVPKRSR